MITEQLAPQAGNPSVSDGDTQAGVRVARPQPERGDRSSDPVHPLAIDEFMSAIRKDATSDPLFYLIRSDTSYDGE